MIIQSPVTGHLQDGGTVAGEGGGPNIIAGTSQKWANGSGEEFVTSLLIANAEDEGAVWGNIFATNDDFPITAEAYGPTDDTTVDILVVPEGWMWWLTIAFDIQLESTPPPGEALLWQAFCLGTGLGCGGPTPLWDSSGAGGQRVMATMHGTNYSFGTGTPTSDPIFIGGAGPGFPEVTTLLGTPFKCTEILAYFMGISQFNRDFGPQFSLE